MYHSRGVQAGLRCTSQAISSMRPPSKQGLLWFRREGGLERITDLEFLHDGAKSAGEYLSVTTTNPHIYDMSISLVSGNTCHLPVTSDLTAELLCQLHKILLVQLPEPRVGQHHAPRHDGRYLAVEVQLLAEVQQRCQVRLAELPCP